jgi:ABC-type arginine/histidine transport system permease subunit
MTPKEKAIELVDKFSNEILLTINGGKVAALIAVDEIIRVLQDEQDWYWEEVQQEIEKL